MSDDAEALAKALEEVHALDRLVLEEACKAAARMLRDLPAQIAAAEARVERLDKALRRQADNMAFIVNHVALHGWYGKFKSELEEDRAALSPALEPAGE